MPGVRVVAPGDAMTTKLTLKGPDKRIIGFDLRWTPTFPDIVAWSLGTGWCQSFHTWECRMWLWLSDTPRHHPFATIELEDGSVAEFRDGHFTYDTEVQVEEPRASLVSRPIPGYRTHETLVLELAPMPATWR